MYTTFVAKRLIIFYCEYDDTTIHHYYKLRKIIICGFEEELMQQLMKLKEKVYHKQTVLCFCLISL